MTGPSRWDAAAHGAWVAATGDASRLRALADQAGRRSLVRESWAAVARALAAPTLPRKPT